MNFYELRMIVGQIKRNMTCPHCKGKYTDQDIDVIGCMGYDEYFFHAFCTHCEVESCIHVTLESMNAPQGPVRLGTAPRMEYVSSNEILDMHNFLKNFNGDFSSIFKPENKPS